MDNHFKMMEHNGK